VQIWFFCCYLRIHVQLFAHFPQSIAAGPRGIFIPAGTTQPPEVPAQCTEAEAEKLASSCADTAYLWTHRLVAAVLLAAVLFAALFVVAHDVPVVVPGVFGVSTWSEKFTLLFALGFLVYLYDILASLLFNSPLWCLVLGQKKRQLQWPTPADMEQALGMPEPLETDNIQVPLGYLGGNHLALGLTRFAFRDALVELLPGYCRHNAWSRWQWLKQEQPQREWMSYDVIVAIQLELAKRGLGQYSLAQVMSVAKHPGASKANCFLSHRQDEEIWETCAAMKHYARTCWREPVFWIDVVSLKQSWDAEVYQNKMGNAFVGDIQFPGDFTFPRIKRCIQNIGNTVMVTQHHGSIPSAMDRIFCIFEVYATTCKNESSSRLAKFHIASSFMYPKLCVVKDHQIRVDVEAAKSTNPDARMTILNNLRDDPGFKEANTICAATIAKSDVENTHQWWFSVLVTSIGIGVIIGLPALGSSLPHYYY